MNSQDPMIDNNDPRLTAYALGELAPADVAQIEAAIKSSPELQAVVADIRRASETISNVFQTEPPLQLTPEQKSQLLNEAETASNFDVRSADSHSVQRAAANVTPAVASEYYQPSSASSAPWLKIAIVAGLASVLVGGGYYLSQIANGPMAAVDQTSFKAESPVANGKAFEDGAEAPQVLPPASEQAFMASKESPDLDKTDSFVPRSPAARKTSEPPKQAVDLPGESDDADAIADLKSDSPSQITPSQNEVADKALIDQSKNPGSMAKSAKNSPLDTLKSKPGADSVLNRLALAQKSIDQSALGSLNLTVVAQNPSSGYLYEGKTEGGTRLRNHPLSPSKPSPPVEKFEAKKYLESSKAAPNLPATFALQISSQDAKQMVALLASDADPLQQRKLSFDDLIGSQIPPTRLAKGAELDDRRPDEGGGGGFGDDFSDFENAPVPEKSSAFKKEDAKSGSPALQQRVAAATLATKLREFVNQPSLALRGNSIPSVAAGNATDGAAPTQDEAPPQADSPPASAKRVQPSLAGKPQTLPDDDAANGQEPQGLTRKGLLKSPLGSPQADLKNKLTKSQRPLNEFDFDYSQVIQQLKLNLEIRNRSLKGLK